MSFLRDGWRHAKQDIYYAFARSENAQRGCCGCGCVTFICAAVAVIYWIRK
jgi:hypothetical protein